MTVGSTCVDGNGAPTPKKFLYKLPPKVAFTVRVPLVRFTLKAEGS